MLLCVEKQALKSDDFNIQKDVNLQEILLSHTKFYPTTEEAYKDDFVPLDFCVCVRSVYSNKVLAFNKENGDKIYYQNMSGVPPVVHKGYDLVMYMTSIGMMHYVNYSKGFDEFMLNFSDFICLGLFNSSSDYINPIVVSHVVIKDEGLELLEPFLKPEVSIEDIASMKPKGNLKPLLDSLVLLEGEEPEVLKEELSDQWKLDGDCRVCRRKDFCKKVCSAHDRTWNRIARNIIRKKTGIDMIENHINHLNKEV